MYDYNFIVCSLSTICFLLTSANAEFFSLRPCLAENFLVFRRTDANPTRPDRNGMASEPRGVGGRCARCRPGTPPVDDGRRPRAASIGRRAESRTSGARRRPLSGGRTPRRRPSSEVWEGGRGRPGTWRPSQGRPTGAGVASWGGYGCACARTDAHAPDTLCGDDGGKNASAATAAAAAATFGGGVRV